MKRTVTILFAAMVLTGLASCMNPGVTRNQNPVTISPHSF